MTRSARVPTVHEYPCRVDTETRWSDNDQYGHLNNAVYYELFDTAINGWIAEQILANPDPDPAQRPMAVVAESACTYFHELSFPLRLTIGFGVSRLGRSSVTYDLVIGKKSGTSRAAGAASSVAARGHWVHVYVDPNTRRPSEIPDNVRRVLASARIEKSDDDTAARAVGTTARIVHTARTTVN